MSTRVLLLPLALLRFRNGEGRRAHLKRNWHSTISLFLLPVMFFGAENIAQASHDAIEYRAVEAAVAAAQAADVPPSSPTGITIHPCHKVSG